MSPATIKGTTDVVSGIHRWEGKVVSLENRYSKSISDNLKIAIFRRYVTEGIPRGSTAEQRDDEAGRTRRIFAGKRLCGKPGHTKGRFGVASRQGTG